MSDSVGTPVNFDSLLPDRDLTQKSRNKVFKDPNNNKNVLKYAQMAHQLYTTRTAQSAIGGPVTDPLL